MIKSSISNPSTFKMWSGNTNTNSSILLNGNSTLQENDLKTIQNDILDIKTRIYGVSNSVQIVNDNVNKISEAINNMSEEYDEKFNTLHSETTINYNINNNIELPDTIKSTQESNDDSNILLCNIELPTNKPISKLLFVSFSYFYEGDTQFDLELFITTNGEKSNNQHEVYRSTIKANCGCSIISYFQPITIIESCSCKLFMNVKTYEEENKNVSEILRWFKVLTCSLSGL